tara:strand:+ start:1607 stop:1822 length:216 start_codon:yes stop_codon:yes gene_type:complete
MGNTSLELVEHKIGQFGFEDSKVVAMGVEHKQLFEYCVTQFKVEPIKNGETIKQNANKIYSIKISDIPIIR